MHLVMPLWFYLCPCAPRRGALDAHWHQHVGRTRFTGASRTARSQPFRAWPCSSSRAGRNGIDWLDGPVPRRQAQKHTFVCAGQRVSDLAGSVPVPFSPTLHDHLDPRSGFWVGTTDALRFTRYSMSGDPVQVVERSERPHRATSADVARVLDDLDRRFGRGLNVDAREIPEELPYWESFLVDASGWLWVQRFEPPSTNRGATRTWEVYDAEGVWLATFDLPLSGHPTPAISHDRIVGTVQDELGVTYVVVFDVHRQRARRH